ncbi:MAG: Holliday junction branch migration protein RuvA [Ginsengibacter sp.]
MIAYLNGKFAYINPTTVYLDVLGVGYEVNISLNTYGAIQNLKEGKLFTHLQIKEDAHTIFGFFDKQEKDMFIMLIGVSGVGAATARLMLSNMLPDEIAKAILNGNARLLESIKGIGRKTAERLVLELRDKVNKQPLDATVTMVRGNTLQQDALNALVALGINKAAADAAVNKVLKDEPENSQLEHIIKKALKSI